MNVWSDTKTEQSLHGDKAYIINRNLVLIVTTVFLMVRLGAIMPDLDKLLVKGFKIVSITKTAAVLYLVWAYLYFSFYQKYWRAVEREITKCKEEVFKRKILNRILFDTHKKHGHAYDGFDVSTVHLSRWLRFLISYAPFSSMEYGEDLKHGTRTWIVDLKLQRNREYIVPYLAEVYLREPIVTAYLVPFVFPIIAFFASLLGNWAGSLTSIISGW